MKEDIILYAFGQRIHQLRLLQRLSQYDLASLADVSRNYISDIERGKSNVSLLIVWRLASSFDMSLCQLFNDDFLTFLD